MYTVPLGGALFIARIVLNTWHPRALGAALITSSLAVAVGCAVTHGRPTLDWPDLRVSYRLIGYLVVLAPLTLAVGSAFNHLMVQAGSAAVRRSWKLVPAIAGAGY